MRISEDRRFFLHPGVDVFAFTKAGFRFLTRRKGGGRTGESESAERGGFEGNLGRDLKGDIKGAAPELRMGILNIPGIPNISINIPNIPNIPGISPPPTVAVMGAPGSSIPAALLHEAFNRWSDKKPLPRNAELTTARICAVSGMKAAPQCPYTLREFFAPGSGPALLNPAADSCGKAVCPRISPGPWNRESPPSPSSRTAAGIPAASRSADLRLYSR